MSNWQFVEVNVVEAKKTKCHITSLAGQFSLWTTTTAEYSKRIWTGHPSPSKKNWSIFCVWWEFCVWWVNFGRFLHIPSPSRDGVGEARCPSVIPNLVGGRFKIIAIHWLLLKYILDFCLYFLEVAWKPLYFRYATSKILWKFCHSFDTALKLNFILRSQFWWDVHILVFGIRQLSSQASSAFKKKKVCVLCNFKNLILFFIPIFLFRTFISSVAFSLSFHLPRRRSTPSSQIFFWTWRSLYLRKPCNRDFTQA